jgi:peptide/nickel transport system substrate-binding protein
MSNKKLAIALSLLLIASLILTTCGPTPEPEEVIVTQVIKETVVVEGEVQVVEKEVTKVVQETVKEEVVVEVTPTPAPIDRMGGWLDMIVVVEEPSPEVAVARLDAGDIDLYSYTVNDPAVFETVKADDLLTYSESVGNFDTLMCNFVGPIFDGTGKLNPFAVEEIRQAVGQLIDRQYIVDEIVGGLGVIKIVPINSMMPDYARYADVMKEMEAEYGYDPEKAKTIIEEEMLELGAEMVDGQWRYNGEPVEIIFLIRTEDERLEIGDYVSNLLDDIGFTVNRQYKTSAEASAIWNQTDPNEGLWHLYTGGWISSAINRDLGYVFAFHATDAYIPWIRWTYMDSGNPEFDDAAVKLLNNDFTSMEERGELFEVALRGYMKYAVEHDLFDAKSFTPRRKEVEVTANLATSVQGSHLWPYTLRRTDEVGGVMTVAMPSILTEPWNPVGGSNWTYEQSIYIALNDFAVIEDPYTGIGLPKRIESGQVYITEGYPVDKTLDWVDLQFEPEIVVPDDAWAGWDPVNQVILTAGEVYTQPRTTVAKYVCNYPDDIFETTWHDGSKFSLGDMVMMYILKYFDQAYEESAIYDEDRVSNLETWLPTFGGVRIASTDPLVVEYYTDNFALDAEDGFSDWRCLYPGNGGYDYSGGPWHMVALGVQAEAAQELTFFQAKSDRLEVEWMNYVGGPSLEILAGYLEEAAANNFIPYAPTMSQYVSAEEAAERWANYQTWYARQGHFWVGNGPYYLDGAFPLEGSVILRHWPDYPDPATKWLGYTEPKIGMVEVDGPGRIASGAEATYDVYITFQGEPYPLDELDSVKYLVFDATGAVAFSGQAEPAEDGRYTITLSADQTSQLEAGANRLQAIVISKVVSVPSTGEYEFVSE